MIEKHNLDYQILSDIDNKLARDLGIVFSLSDELQELYKGFGIDLPGTQGNDQYELPIPATYVVDKTGKIVLADIDIDYTKRLEPDQVIDKLNQL